MGKQSYRTTAQITLISCAVILCTSCGIAKAPNWSGIKEKKYQRSHSSLVSLGIDGPFICPSPTDFYFHEDSADGSRAKVPSLWNLAFQARLSALFYKTPHEIGTTLETWSFGNKGDGNWLSKCSLDVTKLRGATGRQNTSTLSHCGKSFFKNFPDAAKSEFSEYTLANKHNSRDVQYFSTKYQLDRSENGAFGDTEYLWLLHHELGIAMLVFQGSTSAGDALTDFSIAHKRPGWLESSALQGKVHRGFLSAYNDIRDQIWMSVDSLPEDYSLWITGHSLGGALAMLATLDLTINHGAMVSQMTTFGAPKVGNEEFSKSVKLFESSYGVPLVRVRNDKLPNESIGRDLVSFLPLGNPLTGVFKASGTTLSLYSNGTTNIHPKPPTMGERRGITKRLRSIAGHAWNTLVGYRYHSMNEYERRLEKALSTVENQEWARCQ